MFPREDLTRAGSVRVNNCSFDNPSSFISFNLISPWLFFPMTVTILFLLISRVLRNVRKPYKGPLTIDGVFRAASAASASFTIVSGG